MLPKVVIAGRTNVGKSTLFNCFVGFRKALVLDQPGVTRDENAADVVWNDVPFSIVDTGGIASEAEDPLQPLVRKRIEVVLEEASVFLFVGDAKVGLLPEDQAILKNLRKFDRPILMVVNKVDP